MLGRGTISLFVLREFLLHLVEEFSGDNGWHLDRDPLRAITVHRPPTDQLPAFEVGFCGCCYSVEVTRSRICFVRQNVLDPIIVPPTASPLGQNPALFEVAADGNKSKRATCEHLEDRADNRRLFLVDGERGRCVRRLSHVVISERATATARQLPRT